MKRRFMNLGLAAGMMVMLSSCYTYTYTVGTARRRVSPLRRRTIT